MAYDYSVLVDNIRKLAKHKNRKVSDFERFAGVSIGYCSRLAHTGSSPSLEFAIAAESFFGVDIHELIVPMALVDPCPHCGCPALVATDKNGKWYVFCHSCGCRTGFKDTKEDAVDAWNRRV